MARRKPYRNKAGEVVPATTTITSRFGESGGLIYWANQVGLGEHESCNDQERCAQCGRREGKNHRDVSGAAADTGTFAHDLIEEYVKGAKVDLDLYEHLTDEQRENADNCLDSFKRWFDGFGVEILETELPLVSEVHQFGGRIDSVGRLKGGQLIIPDWKTSNGIYGDQLAQLAAYGLLLDEYADDLFGPVDEYHIVRISKDVASFEHRSWTRQTFQPAIDYFLTARRLFGQDKALKKLLK